ncbi:hypothetical protein [Zhouia amylolytica]|uniref:hypothetical protein n=1 Tax=Zhouia amylolytica TaxID=376730 RepID=UPI0020CC7A6C|nr:hypothetical protein [Zhouia amylolytica]MCQ0113037.1 hypothetical protein [Zhouia amylolytica]
MKQLVKLISFALVCLCGFMIGWLMRKEHENEGCACQTNEQQEPPIIINIPEFPIEVNMTGSDLGTCTTC